MQYMHIICIIQEQSKLYSQSKLYVLQQTQQQNSVEITKQKILCCMLISQMQLLLQQQLQLLIKLQSRQNVQLNINYRHAHNVGKPYTTQKVSSFLHPNQKTHASITPIQPKKHNLSIFCALKQNKGRNKLREKKIVSLQRAYTYSYWLYLICSQEKSTTKNVHILHQNKLFQLLKKCTNKTLTINGI
eukprot:TRINITY_DN7935_c1_g1_i1.p3 TRINITY_DN7935_c1_g1~~TRINITY_DN7935_c1_g1_i1.p3  ORF type:complete len:188 (+),score=-21.30 TRINITY_DN7935_c1_g1_i1:304-867(+)